MIELNLDIKFTNKEYKSFLKRLKKFGTYVATVGIHKEEGQQKVIRRYSNPMSRKGGSHIAGKSHRMTIAKLAYQNEFGANIIIKPRYRTFSRTKTKKVYHTFRQRITIGNTVKWKDYRSSNEQGYLLVDKSGKFVAYFQPNTTIKIEPRSFLREVAKNPDNDLTNLVSRTVQSVLIEKAITPRDAIEKIAKMVQYKVKNKMVNSKPNHPLTFKAKGHKTPLIDEQDRLRKAIKYKIYNFKQTGSLGLSGNTAYLRQFESQVDKLLKSAEQYENTFKDGKLTHVSQNIKQYTYSRYNPNFMS